MIAAGTWMAEAAPSLATVLTRWIRQERLTHVQIAAAGGITRSYISALVHDRVARPVPETLRKLARGLATDPDTETLDVLKYEQALRDFAEAVGIADVTHETDRGALVHEIQGLGSNLQAADFWHRLIERHPNPSPLLQQMLSAIADSHDRPGGGDVLSLMLLLSEPDLSRIEQLVRQIRAIPVTPGL